MKNNLHTSEGYGVWGIGYRQNAEILSKNCHFERTAIEKGWERNAESGIKIKPHTLYPIPYTQASEFGLKSKSGFTLIELLVYMVIMGFIIVVAGRVFSDSSVMRVRSQNMVKASEEVGKVVNLINEDISQMGVKSYGQSSASSYSIISSPDVYVSASSTSPTSITCTDCSSFWLFHDNAASASNAEITFDSIAFRKAAFDNDGEFLGVREISWAVNSEGQLFRYCKTISGTSDDECPEDASQVLIAENIKKFLFIPSAPGIAPIAETSEIPRDTVFPLETSTNGFPFKLLANTANNNSRDISAVYETCLGACPYAVVELSGSFIKNNSESPGENDKFTEVYLTEPGKDQYTECLNVPIEDGETYVVEFNMPFPESFGDADAARKDSSITQFLPGIDHIAVGLRYSDGSKISNVSSDVLLYTPQSQDAASLPRHSEFSARGNTASGKNVCVAITFAFYSPLASQGKYRFSNFKVYKKQTGAYHFVKNSNNYESEFAEKYATESDDSQKRLIHKKNVKAFELILEIDKNGEVAGTYSKDSTGMTILVPNNGATQ